MTRPLRMAGVVVVAVLAVVIPAFASGHAPVAAQKTAAASAIACPLANTALHGRTGHRTHVRVAHHRRHRHHGRPNKLMPTIGVTGATFRCLPCPPTGVTGATGAKTATALICRPYPCAYPLYAGASGSTGATGSVCPCPYLELPAGSTGPTDLCPPPPCGGWGATGASGSTGAAGSSGSGSAMPALVTCCLFPAAGTPAGSGTSSGPAILCRPLPCPLEATAGAIANHAEIACPICPPVGATGAPTTTLCPQPCAVANGSARTATAVACGPAPGCPPLPRGGAATASAVMCPLTASGSAAPRRSKRLR